MSFTQFWNRIWHRRSRPVQPLHRQRQARPRLECLEDRTVPSTYYVSTGGADAAGRGGPTNPFRSIQFAVNQAAASGDTVLVATGTYTQGDDPSAYSQYTSNTNIYTTGVVIVYNKEVRILGGYNAANWNAAPTTNPAATVIDGGNQLRGVLAIGIGTTQPTSIDLEDFTIQHGLATGNPSANFLEGQIDGEGGGIFVDMLNQPDLNVQQTFNNLVIQNNTAQGVVTNQTSGTMQGGGDALGGGMNLSYVANTMLTNVTFQSNQALGGTGAVLGGFAAGGGLHLGISSNVTGSNVTLNNNVATGGSTSGSGVSSSGQTADGLGGAVSVQGNGGACTLTLTNSSATGNTATGGANTATATLDLGGSATGGAIESESSNVSLTNCTLTGNIAQGGTAPTAGLSLGGGIGTDSSTVTLNQVSVIQNKALGGTSSTATTDPNARYGAPGGGGLALTVSPNSFTATITNSVIADNLSGFSSNAGQAASFSKGGGGGGIWIAGLAPVGNNPNQFANVTIAQSTIANNTLGANLDYGSGILLLPNANLTLQYSIIANNTNGIAADTSDGALQVFPALTTAENAATANLTTDLFAGNGNNPNGYSVLGPAAGTGTVNGFNLALVFPNAGFVSPGSPNEDYHLQTTSPAINQAVGSPATVDRDGNPRTGVPDIGAYELQVPSVQFSAAQYYSFESAGTVTLTLTRTGDTTGTSTVIVSTGGGTAPSGANGDYTALNQTRVTFPVGATSEPLTITLRNNPVAEASVVNFNVTLSNPSPGTNLGAQTTSVVNLVSSQSSDVADFISDVYHSLLNGPVDAAGFVFEYQTVLPGQTVSYATAVSNSLANDGTVFLTSAGYIEAQVQTAYTAFLGRGETLNELTYWFNLFNYYAGQAATKTTAYENMLSNLVGSAEAIAHDGNSASAWLNSTYEGLLGRAADQAAQTYWGPQLNLSQPSTFINVAFKILRGSEYQADTVIQSFSTLLGRSPSSSDLSFYAGELTTQARAAVVSQIMGSTEYFLDAGNTIDGWINQTYMKVLQQTPTAAEITYQDTIILNGFVGQRNAVVNNVLASSAYQTVLIQNTFQHILRRAASTSSSNNEVAYYLNYLTTHTVEQFQAVLYGSAEYLQNRAGGSEGNWLVDVYQDALGRGISAQEFNGWAQQLNGGVNLTSIASSILGSAEYFGVLTNNIVRQQLGRSANSGETGFYVPLLQTGQMTDASVIAGVTVTPEFFNKSPQFP